MKVIEIKAGIAKDYIHSDECKDNVSLLASHRFLGHRQRILYAVLHNYFMGLMAIYLTINLTIYLQR